MSGHDVQEVPFRKVRPENLEKLRATVGHGRDRPRLASGVMEYKGCGDIRRGEYLYGRTPRFERYTHRSGIKSWGKPNERGFP